MGTPAEILAACADGLDPAADLRDFQVRDQLALGRPVQRRVGQAEIDGAGPGAGEEGLAPGVEGVTPGIVRQDGAIEDFEIASVSTS